MSEPWKELDLQGAGLQTLNIRLMRYLRHRGRAYAAWLLFPLGAHRFYLHEIKGTYGYVALTTFGILLWLAWGLWPALVPWGVEALWALFDLYWIEQRRVAVNKEIRKAAYLKHGATPPKGYRGRYTDATEAHQEHEGYLNEYLHQKEQGSPGSASQDKAERAPSFQDQEAMLRAMRARRGAQEDPSDEESR